MVEWTRRQFLAALAGSACGGLAFADDQHGTSSARAAKSSDPKPELQESRPMNIVLAVCEDMGLQIGCHGDPTVPTPNMDRLAREGVRFDRAFVPTASCSPSRSAIFTGLYPHENGQIGLADECGYTMHRGIPSLPAMLSKAGFRTGLVYKRHVQPDSDIPFDVHYKAEDYWELGTDQRDVRQMCAFTEEFIRSTADQPFFVMVNFSDAHMPFKDLDKGLPEKPVGPGEVKPLPFFGDGLDTPEIRRLLCGYYNGIQRVDYGLGLLLDMLAATGHAEDTLVIFLSDHGPPFTRGKLCCYEAGLHVPFLVRWPGRARSGLASDALVSTVDIMPTCLEAAGLPAPPHLSGRSFGSLVAGKSAVERRQYVCGEFTAHGPATYFPQRSIRDEHYKLIHSLLPGRSRSTDFSGPRPGAPESCLVYRTAMGATDLDGTLTREVFERYCRPPAIELYDLHTDPCEFENLAGRDEYREVERRLFDNLQLWRVETGDPLLDPVFLDTLTRHHDEAAKRIERTSKGVNWPDWWFKHTTDMSDFQRDWAEVGFDKKDDRVW